MDGTSSPDLTERKPELSNVSAHCESLTSGLVSGVHMLHSV